MPNLIRFFFGSAALALGTASAADEATRAVELRKVRRLSCINPLRLRDASPVSGNGPPAPVAFDKHIRESLILGLKSLSRSRLLLCPATSLVNGKAPWLIEPRRRTSRRSISRISR